MSILARSSSEFIECFKEIDFDLDDAREDGKLLYPLSEIILLAVSGVLSCAEGWRQIYDYGVEKLEFLREYLPFKYGIPKKTTLCTVFGAINKNQFESWFMKWAHKLVDIIPGDLINIDGKTIKGSKTKEEKATHVLNVFAKKQGIVIAQRTVDKKTNEIPELPKLIDDLNVKGSTVTIDAIGCQTNIASKIVEKEANYFIGLKENQPKLYDAGRYLFIDKEYSQLKEHYDYYSERNVGHGRIEWRKCWTTAVPQWMKNEYSLWEGLESICMVESERHIGSKRSIEKRYFISSEKNLSAKKGLANSREHWSIENQLHHVLDVTFNEDGCKVKDAAENMSIVRKVVLNLIKKFKQATKNKSSNAAIRKKAAWSEKTASKVLSYYFVNFSPDGPA